MTMACLLDEVVDMLLVILSQQVLGPYWLKQHAMCGADVFTIQNTRIARPATGWYSHASLTGWLVAPAMA
jgi:hypothetical protein